MEVSFDADVAMEHGIRAAVVLNHIAHLMRFPDGSQVGYFKSCGRGLIAEREYDGLDPDCRNWYTLTETGSAVA
ncbi:hypothetical protein V3C10_10975 [[Clostridium] symbiosum]|uniref:hypothetical protein n=1 Tax=Clostridium symbiosum TaxID=1512 RepID=UPI001D07A0BF|nr:hypothetical protein [[Clostridium] symbiosum]MCB6609306.1 hypothetical protein [[Clostridium] symbiosum]MCB6931787.1 hypothetical protein [[Clostridium] symbiosum]